MNHDTLLEQCPADVAVGRHCLNKYCEGPEWWGLFDETLDKYRECPCCGYQCTIEFIPKAELTPEAICSALWVPNETATLTG